MLRRAIASSFQRCVTLGGGGSCPEPSSGTDAMHSKLAVSSGTSSSGAAATSRENASNKRAC